MNVTKRSILIAFVLSVVCGLLYLYTNTFFKTKIVIPEGLPTFIAYDSTISTYGKSGKGRGKERSCPKENKLEGCLRQERQLHPLIQKKGNICIHHQVYKPH